MEEKKPFKLPPRGKSFGRVTDLEAYVQPNWWARIFNSIYLKTDGDVVDDDRITKEEVDLFSKILNISFEDRILDLCCGHGRHSIELARRGFQYVDGLDRSHYLIQKARAQAKKEHLNVRFKEGDARKLPYQADTFDFVLVLGNSFGYFENMHDDLKVLEEIFRVLKPWGKVLIDVADGDYLRKNFQPRSWEWIDKNLYVCRERTLSLDNTRLISREIISHTEKGVLVDQFYSERLYTHESLEDILTKAGFKDITFHTEISPQSARNQDLGMMAKRIIVSAVARKNWSYIKLKKKEVLRNVVVILGDPSKPDKLKPSGIFDDDDFYTIDQLKDALKELSEKYNYRFTYLTNHDTLIQDLIKLKEKGKIDFVFNLCDEGYFNDAQKELHIPALLEILQIPYTGAPPQCLAYCYDKSLVRGIAKEMGINVPPGIFIKPDSTTFEIPSEFPVIVKPNFGDSSFGITQDSVVYDEKNLMKAISNIREKFGYNSPILIEKFLQGKDLSTGIIGNPPYNYIVLPIIEEDYSCLPGNLPNICGYEAKWLPSSPYWNIKSIPAEIPETTKTLIIDWCLKLFERLGCNDYCRFDFRLDEEYNPYLLEVNPNPGWCWDGHLAKMAKFGGMSYSEMLLSILKACENRINMR